MLRFAQHDIGVIAAISHKIGREGKQGQFFSLNSFSTILFGSLEHLRPHRVKHDGAAYLN